MRCRAVNYCIAQRLATLFALLPLAGCSAPRLTLEPRWAPLTEIIERPAPAGVALSTRAIATVGHQVLVHDLADFVRRHPPGSARLEALLLHEQEHASRQEAAGLGLWLARYVSDRAFMWAEEQRGWALELQALRAAGLRRDPREVAAVLTGYRNLEGPMCSYAEALAFAEAAQR